MAACEVGPNYKAPETMTKEQWIDFMGTAVSTTQPTTTPAMAPATAPAADLGQWWNVFNDPVLNSLIHDTNAQNLTLGQAGERITQARAIRDISVGNLFPQYQNLAGSHTVNK